MLTNIFLKNVKENFSTQGRVSKLDGDLVINWKIFCIVNLIFFQLLETSYTENASGGSYTFGRFENVQ